MEQLTFSLFQFTIANLWTTPTHPIGKPLSKTIGDTSTHSVDVSVGEVGEGVVSDPVVDGGYEDRDIGHQRQAEKGRVVSEEGVSDPSHLPVREL